MLPFQRLQGHFARAKTHANRVAVTSRHAANEARDTVTDYILVRNEAGYAFDAALEDEARAVQAATDLYAARAAAVAARFAICLASDATDAGPSAAYDAAMLQHSAASDAAPIQQEKNTWSSRSFSRRLADIHRYPAADKARRVTESARAALSFATFALGAAMEVHHRAETALAVANTLPTLMHHAANAAEAATKNWTDLTPDPAAVAAWTPPLTTRLTTSSGASGP